MGTDTKILDQSPVSMPVSSNVVQPQMGSVNKEAPLAASLSELKPAGLEVKHNVDQELEGMGVKEKTDRPNLVPEHEKLGVDHAGSSIPVSTTPLNPIQYPMSEEEIKDQLKTGQGDSSKKWLARLMDKVIAWGFKAQ